MTLTLADGEEKFPVENQVKKPDLLVELRGILASVLDVDEADMGYETHFMNDLGVDSLMALEVMVTLEKRYKVKLSEQELRSITCLRNVYELLLAKLNPAGSPASGG